MSRFTYTVEERDRGWLGNRERWRETEKERESGWAGFLYLLLGTWSIYLMLKAESMDVIVIIIIIFASDPVAWNSHRKVSWLRSHAGSQETCIQTESHCSEVCIYLGSRVTCVFRSLNIHRFPSQRQLWRWTTCSTQRNTKFTHKVHFLGRQKASPGLKETLNSHIPQVCIVLQGFIPPT